VALWKTSWSRDVRLKAEGHRDFLTGREHAAEGLGETGESGSPLKLTS
jgi:hypothetical protein